MNIPPGHYVIEHVCDLVFPDTDGSLAVVYDAFIDDSKDRHAEKVIVSGVFIGDKQQWSQLRTKWKKRLNSEGMEYFKAAEYYGLRGQFGKFHSESRYPAPTGRQAAKAVFDDLEEIIKQVDLISLGIVIPVQDYNEIMAMPEAKGKIPTTPYHLALNSGFFETIKTVNKIPGRHMVAFVHDDDEKFPRYRESYHAFKEKNPITAKQMAGFVPLDDEQHPPLQAADLAANVTCNFAKEWLENNRSRASLQRLTSSMYKIAVWDKGYLLEYLDFMSRSNSKVPKQREPNA
jgi:hypothetical protein